MKKLFSLFALLCLSIAMFAQGVEETVALANGSYSETDKSISWTAANGNIVLSQLQGSSTSAVNKNYISAPRAYKGHILAFEAKAGYTITKVEIKVTSSYYGNSMVAGTETGETEVTANTTDLTATWTTTAGGTHVVEATSAEGVSTLYIQNVASAANTQLRFTEVKITYIKPVTTDPTIEVADLDFGAYVANSGVTRVLNVVAENLTEAPSYALQSEGIFEVSGTLTTEGGELTVSVKAATEEAVSDVLVITSGDVTKSVNLTANVLVTEGQGTKENPFTIADVVKLNNGVKGSYWVEGLILGGLKNTGAEIDNTNATALALGSTMEDAPVVSVQLPSGDVRTALNVVDNPDNVGKKVQVYGSLEAYCSLPGVKSVSEYVLIRTLAGAYNIGGENADYASLAAACADIDTTEVVGDISLLICADLEEPKNMGIKNASKYTVTITVDQATARKVTFTQAGDNAGPSGNICIGCDMTLTHAGATSLTRNVVIDGSYEGDGERWLTLETAQGVNKYNGPVLIYGNVKDCAVRNTKLIVLNSGSSNYGVVVRTQTGSALAPERITIENNYIQNLGGTSGQGVYFQRASSCTANPSDVSILNNEFVVATRGIFMAANSGTTTIKGNTFSVRQTATGMFSYGIFGNANIEGTIEIAENKFIDLTTAASGENYGIAAIGVGVGGDWTIVNNYITGFNPTSVTTDVQLKGIVSAKVGSVNIAHNTIVLNQLLNAPSAAAEGHIVMLDAKEATSVKNNLVVSYETTALNALVKNASEVCANNIYYTDETAANAYVATTAKTLADYQATEPTAKLIAVNFTDVAAGDLSLTGASVGNQSLGVERLEEVPTDIMGTTRAALTYAGAFEASDLTDLGSSVEALTLNGVWYANGVVYNTANVLLHVYNVNGMLVASGTNNINMNGHADGLYIVRSAEGALKFVK